MQLTKTFPAEVYASALESWSWVGLGKKVPVLASLFGDVFFQDIDGYWFLDSLEGRLEKVASTRDDLQAVLNSQEEFPVSRFRSNHGPTLTFPAAVSKVIR